MYTLSQGGLVNQPQGPRTKSFDNPSASSTSSSGVGTSISSIGANPVNAPLSQPVPPVNSSAPSTPNVVKKYYEQKYGSNTNMAGTLGNSSPANGQNQMQDKMNQQKNGTPKTGSGIFNQAFGTTGLTTGLTSGITTGLTSGITSGLFGSSGSTGNDPATGTPAGGLSSLTSQFTSGIANLKLSASNFQANKFTSKLMNPFS